MISTGLIVLTTSMSVLFLKYILQMTELNSNTVKYMSKTQRSDILSHLKANKLACHSFSIAFLRHKSLGSETKDFITHSSTSSQSISFSFANFLNPNFHKQNKESQVTPACYRLCSRDFYSLYCSSLYNRQ